MQPSEGNEAMMPEDVTPDAPTESGEPAARSRVTRRGLLAAAAASAGGVVLARIPAGAQGAPPKAGGAGAPAQGAATAVPAAGYDLSAVPADPTRAPGPPTSALGARSPFELPARTPAGVVAGSSLDAAASAERHRDAERSRVRATSCRRGADRPCALRADDSRPRRPTDRILARRSQAAARRLARPCSWSARGTGAPRSARPSARCRRRTSTA